MPSLTAGQQQAIEGPLGRSVNFGPLIAVEQAFNQMVEKVSADLFPAPGEVTKVYKFDADFDPILKYELPCTQATLERVGPRLDLFATCQENLRALLRIEPTAPFVSSGFAARWSMQVTAWAQMAIFVLGLNPRFLFPPTEMQNGGGWPDPIGGYPINDPSREFVKGAPCYERDETGVAVGKGVCGGGPTWAPETGRAWPNVTALVAQMNGAISEVLGRPACGDRDDQFKQYAVPSWLTPRINCNMTRAPYPSRKDHRPMWVPADLVQCQLGHFNDPLYHLWWTRKTKLTFDLDAAPRDFKQAAGGLDNLRQRPPVNTVFDFFAFYKDNPNEYTPARSAAGWRLADGKLYGPTALGQVKFCAAMARDLAGWDGNAVVREALSAWINSHLMFFVSLGMTDFTVEELRSLHKKLMDARWDNYKKFSIEAGGALGDIVGGVFGAVIRIANVIIVPFMKWVTGGKMAPGMIPILKQTLKYPQPLFLRTPANAECSTSTEHGIRRFLPAVPPPISGGQDSFSSPTKPPMKLGTKVALGLGLAALGYGGFVLLGGK